MVAVVAVVVVVRVVVIVVVVSGAVTVVAVIEEVLNAISHVSKPDWLRVLFGEQQKGVELYIKRHRPPLLPLLPTVVLVVTAQLSSQM